TGVVVAGNGFYAPHGGDKQAAASGNVDLPAGNILVAGGGGRRLVGGTEKHGALALMKIGIDGTCWWNKRGFGRMARELLGAMFVLDSDH
ncbi:hypothetical protein DF186_16590, partial [Enterococcus hirae]